MSYYESKIVTLGQLKKLGEAGFGPGTTGQTITDANSPTACGFYRLDAGASNNPGIQDVS